MCKSKTKSTRLLLALGLITGQALFAGYSQDPAGCSATGGSQGINIFACTDGTSACTTKVAISGNNPVIAGEYIAYQAQFGPAAGKCAFALGTAGTAVLQLPNQTSATATDITSDVGSCSTSGGPVACTLKTDGTVAGVNGACIGCDGLEAGGVETGASGNFSVQAVLGYTSGFHVYHVAQADFVRGDGAAGACTIGGPLLSSGCVIVAKINMGGTGLSTNDIAFTSSTPPSGPQLATPQVNPGLACGATVDKQVSCDGKLTTDLTKTWYDVTGSDDPGGAGALAKGCIAQVGADVDVQFISKNTGGAAISCTLSDTPGDTPITLLPGQNAVSLGALNATSTVNVAPFACNLTGSQSGNDTATLGSCTCTTAEGAVINGPDSSDTATYSCCGVKVDKQVSCNGGAFVDGTLVSDNEDGTDGCSAINGQTVAIKYRFQNTGNTTLTCNGDSSVSPGVTLGLTDTYVAGGAACNVTADCHGSGICPGAGSHCVPFPTTGEGTLAGGLTSSFISNSNVTACSSTLNTAESLGDKAVLDCTCNADTHVENNVAVSADDIAQIQCNGTSTFTTQKTCVPPGKACTVDADCPSSYSCTAGQCSNTTFVSDVKVTNTGTNQESCAISDQVLTAQVCGTLPSCASPLTGGTPVTMSPNPLIVTGSTVACGTAGNPACNFGDSTGALSAITATACNQACVTCTPDGGTALAPQAVQAECPVGSCFSRTPGYWGTHPQVTNTLLPLIICGITLTTTNAGSAGSATEDLCGTGGPDFKPNNTSPQQLQLIRQCTSAALNMKASGSGDLGAGTAACEGVDPGIAAAFGNCCVGTGSTCDSGASSKVINTSSCITILDAFNNQFEGSTFQSVGLTNSPAQPGQCQIANGNGFVNPGRNLGGK